MPDEAAVADKPEAKAEETVAAKEAEQPPPVKGDDKQATEGTELDLASVVKDMSVDEVRAFIESLPKETRKEALAEIETAAEERGRVRKDEMDRALAGRSDAYETLIEAGTKADNALATRINSVARHMESFDYDEAAKLMQPAAIAQLVEDYKNGAIAQVGKLHDGEVGKFRTKYAPYLKDLSSAQDAQLADARYQDARRGTLSQLEVMVDIIIERHGAEQETKGQEKGKKSVDPALLERLEKFRDTQARLPKRVNGTRAASKADAGSQIEQEMRAIDVTTPAGREEFERRSPELQRRLKALRT